MVAPLVNLLNFYAYIMYMYIQYMDVLTWRRSNSTLPSIEICLFTRFPYAFDSNVESFIVVTLRWILPRKGKFVTCISVQNHCVEYTIHVQCICRSISWFMVGPNISLVLEAFLLHGKQTNHLCDNTPHMWVVITSEYGNTRISFRGVPSSPPPLDENSKWNPDYCY
jgi:hypothetical protein